VELAAGEVRKQTLLRVETLEIGLTEALPLIAVPAVVVYRAVW
jgi:hypothetical protein